MYVTVRVKVHNIKAHTMRQAIETAEKETDLAELFPYAVLDGGHIETEYAEEVTAFLVDVVGDDEYRQSKVFQAHDDGGESEPAGRRQPGVIPRNEAHQSCCDLPMAIQALLANAQYYGDGYTLVLTSNIESVQAGLREVGITPNEPQTYSPS